MPRAVRRCPVPEKRDYRKVAFLRVGPGRPDSSKAKKLQQTTANATSSDQPGVRFTFDDLTNRTAMLADVQGRVSLMERDLSVLMRWYAQDFQQ